MLLSLHLNQDRNFPVEIVEFEDDLIISYNYRDLRAEERQLVTYFCAQLEQDMGAPSLKDNS